MAIKGGNPLFKLDVDAAEQGGFNINLKFPTKGILSKHIPADHPLAGEFMYFGIVTKTRNHIGAVKEEERNEDGAYARAQALFEAYDNGEWGVAGDGEGAPLGGVVARAMARVLNRDVSVIVNHIRAQFASIENEKERAKQLRKAWDNLGRDAKFASMVKTIKDEDAAKREALRAAQTVDTASNEKLIAMLEALPAPEATPAEEADKAAEPAPAE